MVQPWGAGNGYQVGEVVSYEGFYYKVIQAHTSQNDWAPDRTPALWGRQGQCEQYYKSEADRNDLRNAHEEVTNAPHKAKLSHELIAGAAAFEAAKAYEHHQIKKGETPSHANAKAFFAGIIGASVDRLVETKGLDAIDKAKAKKHAEERFDSQTNFDYGKN
ncbi:hypothetical protein FRB95_009805 [Tulasnella sp. JGI-2019a]|nr:hypothetical protein FRB93_009749 [Tulasnella sp. JGI-2019a]KAG9025761.1 hypothetical protein FRB95_009805 [Tulasnella sp. JGI-2019a]